MPHTASRCHVPNTAYCLRGRHKLSDRSEVQSLALGVVHAVPFPGEAEAWLNVWSHPEQLSKAVSQVKKKKILKRAEEEPDMTVCILASALGRLKKNCKLRASLYYMASSWPALSQNTKRKKRKGWRCMWGRLRRKRSSKFEVLVQAPGLQKILY